MDRSFWLFLGLAALGVAGGASFLWVSDARLDRVVAGVQASLLVGMFLVTAFYSKETRKIAQETMNLAEEASNLRQSELLPIIDIVPDQGGVDLIQAGLAARDGEYPQSVSCRLTNVGRGPAFHCAYQAVHSGDQVASLVEPTFLAGQTMDSVMGPRSETHESARSEHSRLALLVENQDDGSRIIRVTYQGVFGRGFCSTIGMELVDRGFRFGPLGFKQINELARK